MRIHADFTQPVTVTPDQFTWAKSPQAGVERMMLDRIGDEVARATSLVRYAPQSYFPRHVHARGEEILVLSGLFCDESGAYGTGSYVRNPPGSSHQPFTEEGALIFVKLRQMHPNERHTVRMDTHAATAWHVNQPGQTLCPLFANRNETVCLRQLEPGRETFLRAPGGMEILVLAGHLRAIDAWFPTWSWLRLPPGSATRVKAGRTGARFYLKTGHLSAMQG